MAEEPSDFRHELGYLEMIYSEFLKVREGGKATHGTPAEPSRSEFVMIPQADPKSLDKRKQTKIVRSVEWHRPFVFLVALIVVGCEGVMKVRDGSIVPQVACHGTRQEAAHVVNEVEDDHFNKL